MKAKIFSINNEAAEEIELPACFNEQVREDLIQKVYEASKKKQPYAPYYLAGMRHSASGIIKHARRKWKTAYGYGISRVPRKIFSRSGNRFNWAGAEIASARGGRQAHPPKVEGMINDRKINKKEFKKSIISALAASSYYDLVSRNYPKLTKLPLPLIFESKITELKANELNKLLAKNLNPYSKRVLILTAKNEKLKAKNFDNSRVSALKISELTCGGRPGKLIVFTEKAIEELKQLK